MGFLNVIKLVFLQIFSWVLCIYLLGLTLPAMPVYSKSEVLPQKIKEPQIVQDAGDSQVSEEEEISENEQATEAVPSEVKGKPSKSDAKGGDTYNFYFQKAPGAQKVKQGKEQTVEQEQSEIPPSQIKKEKAGRVVDVFLGVVFLPGKSGTGLTIGGDFLPKNKIGVRFEFFSASNARDGGGHRSFSAFGANRDSSKNEVLGGGIALTLNVFNNDKVKVSPLLGLLLVNDKSTTTSHFFDAFGGEDRSDSTSHFRLFPFLGVSGTVYFSDNFGMNLAASVPTDPKYTLTSLSIVFSF